MDWKQVERDVDSIVGAAFGELVRHAPMTSSGTVDTTRPAADIRGILHVPTAPGVVSFGAGMQMSMTASEGALVIERAAYPDRVFKAKDKIRGLELPGQPWWEVKSVNDRFSSIIVLVLNQA